MSRIAGFGVGVFFVLLAFLAFRRSAEGWGAEHTDLGFWWAVTATLLALAAIVVLVGTAIHSRPPRSSRQGAS